MRFAQVLGTLASMLLCAALASAQTTAAVVQQPDAEVRSGPSDASDYYATNRLRAGDRVEVVRQEPNGWVAIKPPPGSFSWINKRFLLQVGKNTWTVQSEADVDVLYGSTFHKDKPSVISARVARGTQVRSVGEVYVPADGGMWLPIEPPPTEVRYIRAASLAAETVTAQNPPPPFGGGQSAGAGTQRWPDPSVPLVPAPAAAAPTTNPRWAEAERLEKAGRIREAIDLYNQLGRDVANTDHELSMRCYNQASALQRGSGYAVETRLRPVAAGAAPGVTTFAPQACCAPCGQSDYVFRGLLREAHHSLDYKRTFVLLNSQGQLVAYVTPAGADLEKQLNHVVEVSGAACYRGDVRCNCVRASRVTPLQ
jgi:hypothetical protein